MEILEGKTLVFSDQHFGVKGNSPLRQKIGVQAIKEILGYAKKSKAKNIIFCGDWFHSRATLDVSTLDIAYKCVQALAKQCKLWMILGNHDLYLKNSTEVSSVNIFKNDSNVVVVDKPLEVMLNSKKALLVPWLANLDGFKKDSYDFMLGHFEISSKFLVQSYIEEHSGKLEASESVSSKLDEDDFLGDPGAISAQPSKSSELLGSFIELVKPRTGIILAGHIHQHKEMLAKNGRKFIFIGTPYEQNLGELGNACGFYEISEEGKLKFNKLDKLPKHIQLKTSEIKKIGFEEFDFSEVSGNIVQKIYDEELSQAEEAKLLQKINDFKPYEELLPEYKVAIQYALKSKDDQTSVELLQKSKLEYIKNYIDNMDSKVLEASNVDRDKLFGILESYYKRVVV
jgi:DNA repair exonuclease SbcCD nuclease subunit